MISPQLIKSFIRKTGVHKQIIRFALVIFFLIPAIVLPLVSGMASDIQLQVTQTENQTPTQTPELVETPNPSDLALTLLESLTPEELVGQLFLVTFDGTNIGAETQIYDLITNYHIGGTILRADKDNFTFDPDNPGGTIQEANQLIRQLQTTSWEASRKVLTNPATSETYNPEYIPLFIGISQEGDGYKFDQIINGMTPLPNYMAIGATWNKNLAREIGTVLGSELQALGFNLLVGPSLDVLEVNQLDRTNNLGTRSFGGDPYWVGEMGKAYIEGLHSGGNGNLAVISKHFPGHGGSDRLPEEEVSTVRKTLEQLKSFELAPFFSVTGNAPTAEAATDGLLTSHIRYQGFQGNIRATTRPVSFDPQALNLLMDLPEFESWRLNGGVMVSDDLGSEAIRKFYEFTNQPFDMPRRVALNAFLAGNDILYIADFSSDQVDSYQAAIQTFEFFAQKYREDPAFAQRVNESVLRILRLKYKLYEEFSLSEVIPANTELSVVGQSTDVSFEAAQEAATLISPSQVELEDIIPDPPNQNDRIVFVTDSRSAKQCSECPEQQIFDYQLLEETVLLRYGPQAGGQVIRNNMISYPLSDLQEMLLSTRGSTQIERSLSRANWIVFALLDDTDEHPSYQILKEFLGTRPDLFQQKRLIVFAFNAPYFLDATNISKVTGYYSLYSKSEQSVNVAAYLLFKEQIADGASPVSIPGISYDINEILFPDPNQIIPLELDLPEIEETEPPATPEPLPTPEYKVGDVVAIRTGIIFDMNGNPVPDGTPVKFNLVISGEPIAQQQTEITIDGIARTNFTINDSGLFEITAESERAQSDVFRLDIPPLVEIEEPSTPQPTDQQITPGITTPTPSSIPTATPTVTPEEQAVATPPFDIMKLFYWLGSVLISILVALISYRLGSINGNHVWGVRSGLLVIIGGMLAYIYYVLELPGTEGMIDQPIYIEVLLFTLLGVAIGLLIAWSWRLINTFKIGQDKQINNK